LPDAPNAPEPAQDAPVILAGPHAAPAAHADAQAPPAAVPVAGERDRRNPHRNKPGDPGAFVTDGGGAYSASGTSVDTIPTYIDTLLNYADMISKAKFPSAAFHRRALDTVQQTPEFN
jgi:hypothetical protein